MQVFYPEVAIVAPNSARDTVPEGSLVSRVVGQDGSLSIYRTSSNYCLTRSEAEARISAYFGNVHSRIVSVFREF